MNDRQTHLGDTQSLCPRCLKVVDARIVERDWGVYMEKSCPDHGSSSVKVWPDADHYHWVQSFNHSPVEKTVAYSSEDCPTSCGLCSLHRRHSTLIEVEVTQRCNLRCPVCFMSADSALPDPGVEQLQQIFLVVVKKAGRQTSIQLTGGEPTTRADLPDIVHAVRQVGFEAVEINTNGIAIAHSQDYLNILKDAGISGIYLQFDGLTPEVYASIRGRDLFAVKLSAIENCRRAGIPVVLAMTIIQGINDDQIGAVVKFGLENPDVICGIALQPAFTSGRFEVGNVNRLTMGDVVFKLSEQTGGLIQPYEMWPLDCSHPLCSCGTQLIERDGGFIPATRIISREEYREAYDPHSPQGSIFADLLVNKTGRVEPGLSIVVMNYMDALSMDLSRLKECSMTVATDEGRLIPFCAYQVTDKKGKRLYSPWLEKTKAFRENLDGMG